MTRIASTNSSHQTHWTTQLTKSVALATTSVGFGWLMGRFWRGPEEGRDNNRSSLIPEEMPDIQIADKPLLTIEALSMGIFDKITEHKVARHTALETSKQRTG